MSLRNQFEELTQELQLILDLEEIEAQTYLYLLRMGPVTASALAKEMKIDRAKMYRLCDKLADKNILGTTLSNPKKCIAAKPEDLLQVIQNKKQGELDTIIKSGKQLIFKINNKINIPETNPNPMFRTIQGKQHIYEAIASALKDNTGIFYIFTSNEDVARMYHSSIPEMIAFSEKNGGKIRLIVNNLDIELKNYIDRFNASESKFFDMPNSNRLVVDDKKSVILCDSSIAIGKNYHNDFAIKIDSLGIVKTQLIFCHMIWEMAKPIKPDLFNKKIHSK